MPDVKQLRPECQKNLHLLDSYLRRPIGVHQNHVLSTLFDLELDVILSFQGGKAAAAAGVRVGGIWGQRAFWVKMRKKV